MSPIYKPIFLLGTGRCGSTFQQQTLCNVEDIWIWGEHDGAIQGFLEWLTWVKNNQNLHLFSYKHDLQHATSMMTGKTQEDGLAMAWMNGFRPDDLDEIGRQFLINLFTLNLPQGKQRWGFKEIRYGDSGHTVETLLQLFPEGRVLHTVRHPVKTIESNLLMWNRNLIKQIDTAEGENAIRQQYLQYVDRWVAMTKYFVDQEKKMPHQIMTVKTENFIHTFPLVADFLGISRTSFASAVSNNPINSDSKKGAVAREVSILLNELREITRPQLVQLAESLEYELCS